jgi:hypothetical protein
MTVGIPGTGVGGLFYLAAAVLLPFRALGRKVAARPGAFGAAVRHAALAVAMFAGMWATGWCVAFVVGAKLVVAGTFVQRFATAGRNNLIQWALLSFGYLVLGLLLLAVEAARVLVKRRRRREPRRSGEHRTPVAVLR